MVHSKNEEVRNAVKGGRSRCDEEKGPVQDRFAQKLVFRGRQTGRRFVQETDKELL